LEISFDSAQGTISEFVSEEEIEEARNTSEEWTLENVTAARIYVIIGNLQRYIYNWENVTKSNWLPGSMATADGIMDSIKEHCNAYSGKS
jgi:hypothetical protein